MIVSVITPLYKGDKYVDKICMMIEKNAEVLKDNKQDCMLEVIFVNDYPEKKIEIINRDKYPLINIRIFNNNQNMGIHKSRIKGLVNSSGDYIIFLDQDDVLFDSAISTYLVAISETEQADLIVANGYRQGNGYKNKIYKTIYAHKLVKHPRMYIWGTDMILSPGQCIIKKNSIPIEWEKHFLSINGCDDFLLWLLMMRQGSYIEVCNNLTYSHIETEDNYSNISQNMTESFNEMCSLLRKHRLISKRQIDVLVRRYKAKTNWKRSHKVIQRLWIAISNVDVFLYTALYKVLGYY